MGIKLSKKNRGEAIKRTLRFCVVGPTRKAFANRGELDQRPVCKGKGADTLGAGGAIGLGWRSVVSLRRLCRCRRAGFFAMHGISFLVLIQPKSRYQFLLITNAYRTKKVPIEEVGGGRRPGFSPAASVFY